MQRALLLIIGTLVVSGCASTKKEPVDSKSLSIYQQKILEEDRITNEVLSKAAALSAKSLAVFVRTEQAVHQPLMSAEEIRQARFQNDYIPVNMEQMIEYHWDAAPEALLDALAMNTGYKVYYHNERHPIPKAVTISSKSRMVIDYINIIEQQSQDYIDRIFVDDKYDKKIIHVFYSKF